MTTFFSAYLTLQNSTRLKHMSTIANISINIQIVFIGF